MRVQCLQHVPFEGPGAIARWALMRGHAFETAHLYAPEAAHPDEPFDMLVVMGGPMAVHDEEAHPWLPQEKRFIADAIEADVLVLGVCLGAQILAEVLGGEVRRAEHREIGWYPVTLTEEARSSSAIFSRLPQSFPALHWHGDTFSIPPGAVYASYSEATEHQAFEYDGGRIVGLQFHLECMPESLARLIEHAQADLAPGPWVSSAEEMLAPSAPFEEANRLLYTMLDAMAALGPRDR